MPLFHNVSFFTSAYEERDLPPPAGVEIAFAGRSNAGKSSVINTLTNQNRLAFVSKTPGRTQHINFFQVNTGKFLVDLPGYGYAKVPASVIQHWQKVLENYLQTRQSLKGLILIMDIRHPLKTLDIRMLDWFTPRGKAVHILLTKADKLSKQQANSTLKEVNTYLGTAYSNCSVQLFSSQSALGVDTAFSVIDGWFNDE
ncbi:ribosome biogenesis GTP-binding protein YihA/YsxC [Nitrosomonas sp.]|uniref:ribosome biogenesis GTP-binding protein YihA/YsxC n=1 Tax=Nitrosomonas sp. TaxID=42353 RepID=UPI001D590447|nr:ribosome biogenesis GTP-binding protein YihA/YsxC [Nitrosomonas sp.]MBX3616421.1 ribosome biogenesis GTP-binding protein YihA/YsxC [Nitrosomonas sp.]